jgi:hypothetical protein
VEFFDALLSLLRSGQSVRLEGLSLILYRYESKWE